MEFWRSASSTARACEFRAFSIQVALFQVSSIKKRMLLVLAGRSRADTTNSTELEGSEEA